MITELNKKNILIDLINKLNEKDTENVNIFILGLEAKRNISNKNFKEEEKNYLLVRTKLYKWKTSDKGFFDRW